MPEEIKNPFVPVYSAQSDWQTAKVKAIKDKAFDLYKEIATPPEGSTPKPRDIALAKTYLEISVMLAVRGVTNPTVENA